MNHPPPVSVRCGGSRAWTWAVAGLAALTGGALGAWLAAWGGVPQAALLSMALAAAAAGLACRPWVRPPGALLAWDGGQWRVDGVPASLQVALDLGPWMLLRLRPEPDTVPRVRPSRWLPVAASEAGPAWHGLRVAAHARVPESAALPRAPHV
jgi:hypothetical protein